MEMNFDKLLLEIKSEYNSLKEELLNVKIRNKELESELSKDIEVKELKETIKRLQEEVHHYGIPKFCWDNLKKKMEENHIPYWDKIIIEEFPETTAYTIVYRDIQFTEYD